MIKNKVLRNLLIILFASLFIILLQKIDLAGVNVGVSQEKREPAQVKITSEDYFSEVKIYKKTASGKYVLIYLAKPEEKVKSFECKIPIRFLSSDGSTDFKFKIEGEGGKVLGEEETTIDPIPEAEPINPEETETPSSTTDPIPTKPTPSTISIEDPEPEEEPEPEPEPEEDPEPEPEDPDKVYKVLIIGNSYTYYNDLGGILAELGQKTDKKMIVVEATHGGYVPDQFVSGAISGYYWDNRESPTKVVLNDGQTKNYNTTLTEVFNRDWADLGRKGKWDYIFFQNYAKDNDKIAEGDTKIFDIVKSGLENKKNYIIIGTYYKDTDGKDRIPKHAEAAKKNGTSVMDIADIMDGYSSDWRKECTILDKANHPTATQQYLVATGMYARIFGKENLAKTSDDKNFIKVYNESGKKLKDVIASTDLSFPKKGQTETCNSVTSSKAKKIQALIYKNYEQYIMYEEKTSATKTAKVSAKSTTFDFEQKNITIELHTAATLKLNSGINPRKMTWSTSNYEVLEMTNYGEVRARGKGYAVVTAKTDDGKEAKCNITVVENGLEKKAVKGITPYKTIKMQIDNDSAWKTGQGAARIKVDGKWYMVCAVIQTGKYANRDKANTMVYIVDEETDKTVAIVNDYCFGHANGGTSDGKYVYFGTGKKIWRLSKKYVKNAIKEYSKNGNKIITENFTKNYVKEYSLNDNVRSLGYDSTHKILYSTTKASLSIVKLGDGTGTVTEVLKFPHIKEEIGSGEYLGNNAGVAFYGDYMLMGRYFDTKVDGQTKNCIDVFKCTFDSDKTIYKVEYKSTIVLNKTPMKSREIENIQSIGDGKFVAYYNSHGNSGHTNNIYYFDASEAFK